MILDRLNVATVETQRIACNISEKLVIAICPTLAEYTPALAESIRQLRHLRPDLQFALKPSHSNDQPHALRAGEVQIGLLLLNMRQSRELDYRILEEAPLQIAVPSIWGEPHRSLDLRDIKDWPFVMPHPKPLRNRPHPMQEYCKQSGIDLTIAATCEDVLTTQIMIRSGIGAAFVAGHARQEGADIMSITNLPESFNLNVAVAWHEASTSSLVQEFVGLICSEFRPINGS